MKIQGRTRPRIPYTQPYIQTRGLVPTIAEMDERLRHLELAPRGEFPHLIISPIHSDTFGVPFEGAVLTYNGSVWYPGPGLLSGTHHLLDGRIHTDTRIETVSRGSLIAGMTGTAGGILWDELVIGPNNTWLHSNGLDPSWQYMSGTAAAGGSGLIHFDYIVDVNYTGVDGTVVTLVTGSTTKIYSNLTQALINDAALLPHAATIGINPGNYLTNVAITSIVAIKGTTGSNFLDSDYNSPVIIEGVAGLDSHVLDFQTGTVGSSISDISVKTKNTAGTTYAINIDDLVELHNVSATGRGAGHGGIRVSARLITFDNIAVASHVGVGGGVGLTVVGQAEVRINGFHAEGGNTIAVLLQEDCEAIINNYTIDFATTGIRIEGTQQFVLSDGSIAISNTGIAVVADTSIHSVQLVTIADNIFYVDGGHVGIDFTGLVGDSTSWNIDGNTFFNLGGFGTTSGIKGSTNLKNSNVVNNLFNGVATPFLAYDNLNGSGMHVRHNSQNGVLLEPEYVDLRHATGRFYSSPLATSTDTLVLAANTLYAVPFFVPETRTYATESVEVTTQAGQKFRMGIYRDLNGAPDARVVDAGETTLAGTGSQSKTITQILYPGWYWLALVCDGTPTMRSLPASGLLGYLGFSSGVDTTYHSGWSVAFTYAALPATFTAGGALMAGSAPRLMLSP